MASTDGDAFTRFVMREAKRVHTVAQFELAAHYLAGLAAGSELQIYPAVVADVHGNDVSIFRVRGHNVLPPWLHERMP